jgi:hypothetical protein
MALSAEATAADIADQAKPHDLRFPFILDPKASLRQQVEASGYAPASSRFGPLCDNIVGMNWKLPNGRVIRFGERVVKTTTGYDLFRFLLSSRKRFGSPVDYVIRLRNDVGMTSVCDLSGDVDRLKRAAKELLNSCWMHWFDAVDFVTQADCSQTQLRISINCPAIEWNVVESFLSSFATSQDLELSIRRDTLGPMDGCPDLVLKTTADEVISVANDVSTRQDWNCIGIIAAGVVHFYKNENTDYDSAAFSESIRKVIQHHEVALHQIGGDWHSRHLDSIEPSEVEAKWIDVLNKEFAKP